jgi:hypothetical protein
MSRQQRYVRDVALSTDLAAEELADLRAGLDRLPIGTLLSLLENRAVRSRVLVSPVTWHPIPRADLEAIRAVLIRRVHDEPGHRWRADPKSHVVVRSDGARLWVELGGW